MNIGVKIRELRKKRGMTQEQLAQNIGISFQAVSKWENGVALPDISLVTVLASCFGVTTDELLDFSLKELETKVKEICCEAYEYRESDPAKSRSILEAGLKQYPENDVLLNNLLYVSSGPDETIEIASALIQNTSQSDVRYDAYRFLAYAYKEKGDLKSAAAAVEQIPEIYFTKLTEVAFLLEGKEKHDAAEKQKHISFENLIQMMWKLAECYEENGETDKAIAETEKALGFVKLFDDYRYDSYTEYFTEQIDRMKNSKAN